jgi:hypothetical protein
MPPAWLGATASLILAQADQGRRLWVRGRRDAVIVSGL